MGQREVAELVAEGATMLDVIEERARAKDIYREREGERVKSRL